MIPTWGGSAALRFLFLALLALGLGALLQSTPAHAAPSDVVISQVYGGGGVLYAHDFVELHNRGTAPVNVTGWSVQFSDASSASWVATVIFGTIPPGGYYLVRGAVGPGGGVPLPFPDQLGTLPIHATDGKVALVNRSNRLSGAAPPAGSGIVDLLGYGAATTFEGVPAPPLSATTAALRLVQGCTDSDHNLNDFAIGSPSPRNSSSPLVPCGVTTVSLTSTPNPSRVGESVNLMATVTPSAATGTVEFFDGVTLLGTSVLVSGSAILATNSIALGPHSLTAVCLGDGTFTGSTSPAHNHSVIRAATTTSLVSAPDPSVFGQSVTLTATVAVVLPGAGTPVGIVEFFDGVMSLGTSPLVAGQAAFSTSVPPVGGYSLTAVYSGDANFLTSASAVDPHTVAPVGALVVSQVYGGGGQPGSTFTHDFVELFNRSPHPVNLTGWTVQYAGAGSGVWNSVSPTGVIQAHSYFLVRQAAGGLGSTPLPTPDATGSVDLNGLAGKVALVSSLTALTGNCPLPNPAIVDVVGYGGAECSETSPAPGPSNLLASLRIIGGCIDSDNNSIDFAVGVPNPRNSSSPTNSCTFTLTVNVDPPGTGSMIINPNASSFSPGAIVQLTAQAAGGYHFDRWSGGTTGSVNPKLVEMNGNLTITAHFVTNAAAGQMVISQFFGGGGDLQAGLTYDYVELYNRGNAAVNVTGWTLQFATATGTAWNSTPLFGVVQPGHYYLAQLFGGGGDTTTLVPDVIGALNLGAFDGKLALVSSASLLTGVCPSGASVQDFVGYGGADCFESSPATATSPTDAAFRGDGGCLEGNDNGRDFATRAPLPRNSGTAPYFCDTWLGVETMPTALALSPPAPNPSRGRFNFSLGLPVEGLARVTISDVLGRRIASLVNGALPAGQHNLSWAGAGDAGPVSAGLYFVTLEHLGQRVVRSFVIVR